MSGLHFLFQKSSNSFQSSLHILYILKQIHYPHVVQARDDTINSINNGFKKESMLFIICKIILQSTVVDIGLYAFEKQEVKKFC